MENLAWNLESEYPSITSPEFEKDFSEVQSGLAEVESRLRDLQPRLKKSAGEVSSQVLSEIQALWVFRDKWFITLANLHTYLSCSVSVDSKNAAAQKKMSEVSQIMSKMAQAVAPLKVFILKSDDLTFEKFLAHPELKTGEFYLRRDRAQAEFLLSDSEEQLVSALGQAGHNAWGKLYTNVGSSMRCEMRYSDRTETVGLSKAHALTRASDEETRKVAWKAIQEAWTIHEETAAGILNALAGWRHELNAKQSAMGRKKDFLDDPTFNNRVSFETLESMIGACRANAPAIQQGMKVMAQLMKKPKLDPWDLLAPSPVSASGEAKSFSEAIEIVREAFATVDPKMGEFVTLMAKNRWLEGRVLPNKSTGAYCTNFAKSKEPRVFMTFMGSASDILTLAHEIGHAYHSWVMRDLPQAQRGYPSTLAETASVFAETVLNDALLSRAKTREEKIEFAWGEAERGISFCLNIPARFDFEKNFYEKRKKNDLTAKELCDLTDEAWTGWYGDTLSANDKLYWAHKMHFAMAGRSFYNFPYTFGYLFSLSIYARRKQLGDQFVPTYINILRDTGRMSAEDLIQKHLGEDIRRPEFWQKAIDVVKTKIENFKELANS